MYELILPLGIINFTLVLVQILGGMKIIKISYKTHKYLGLPLVFLHLSMEPLQFSSPRLRIKVSPGKNNEYGINNQNPGQGSL